MQLDSQNNAVISQQAAQLAHQLRTPLATAMLYAQHCTRPELNSASRQRFLQKVNYCLSNIESLIDEMLRAARGVQGTQITVTTDNLIDELQHIIEPMMIAQGSKLIIDNSLRNRLIKINRKAVLAALHNLINNAIEASPQGRGIKLNCCELDGKLALLVVDAGSGIANEDKQSICQAFYTTKSTGTGLGLALVHEVARQHHGQVWINSHVGIGSEIGMLLPVLTEQGSE